MKYQQNILRREIKRCACRLRKPSASVDNAEAEFVVVAMRYLSGLSTAEQDREKNAAVMETVAALPPAEFELPTRHAVREAATACLPLVQRTRE